MRAVSLLSLSLLSACVESASAQPRPDAGRRFNIRPPANHPPRRADPRQVNRAMIRALLGDGDAGVAGLFQSSTAQGDVRDGLAGLALQSPGDGGLGAMLMGGGGRSNIGMGGLGGYGFGTRGAGPGSGPAVGLGRLGGGASLGVRYDEVTVQGELPRWAVRVELNRAAMRTQQCLRALGPHGPVDAPVRWIVRPPTTVDAVTVDGASEGVTRCAREALQRMILGPVTAPLELSAWLRAAAFTP